jgi:enoyl-[acyl-carrier-protein] reductase (NADH)
VVFGLHAKAAGITSQQFRSFIESLTHRRKSATLQELADVAAFVVSDKASGLTGTIVNVTGGIID